MTARNFLYAWMPVMAILLTAAALWLAHEVQPHSLPTADAPAAESGNPAPEAETEATAEPVTGEQPVAARPAVSFFLTLCFIMILGALGAHIQAIISFADYIGNQKFKESWTFFYVQRPFVGATISLLTFSLLRGGFVDAGTTSAASQGIWGTVAIGLMAGLFSRQAMDKIAEIFGVVFSGRKVQRHDSLDRSAALQTPELLSADPETIERGQEANVTLTGSNFHRTTEIHAADEKLLSALISDTQIQVTIPKALTKIPDLESLEVIAINPKAPSPNSEPMTLSFTD